MRPWPARRPSSRPDRHVAQSPSLTGAWPVTVAARGQLSRIGVRILFQPGALPQQRAKATGIGGGFRCAKMDTLVIRDRCFRRQYSVGNCRHSTDDQIRGQSVHNPTIMRVLIADRNVSLLESISLAFIHQFSIHTASTRQRCADLLRQSEFDLVIVCEKLADGPGLQLLGEIARSSPDTLRIFAARRSRLQLLKGRLRPFGLFRTLSYPLDARRLLSTLTLARAGLLQIDKSAPGIANVVVEERQADVRVRSARARAPSGGTPRQSARAPRTGSVAPVSPSAPHQLRNGASRSQTIAPQPAQLQLSTTQSAPSQAAVAPSATPPRLPSQSASFQRALARREAAKRAASEAGSGWISELAPSPPLGALPELATLSYPTRNAKSADAAPKRATVFLGATLVSVFLVTTLTLRLFDGTARSSSARTTEPGALSSHFSPIERPEPSAPSQNSTPAAPKPSAQLAVSKPNPAPPPVAAMASQMAADNTPIADPSTFGSEAAEPIYN